MKYIMLFLALVMFLRCSKSFFTLIFAPMKRVDYPKFEKTIKDLYEKDKDKDLVFTVMNVLSLFLVAVYIIISIITMVYIGKLIFVIAGMYLIICAFAGYNHICGYVRAILNDEPTYKFKKLTFTTYASALVTFVYNAYFLYYVISQW